MTLEQLEEKIRNLLPDRPFAFSLGFNDYDLADGMYKYHGYEWLSPEDKEKALQADGVWSLAIHGTDLDSLTIAASSVPLLMQMLGQYEFLSEATR